MRICAILLSIVFVAGNAVQSDSSKSEIVSESSAIVAIPDPNEKYLWKAASHGAVWTATVWASRRWLTSVSRLSAVVPITGMVGMFIYDYQKDEKAAILKFKKNFELYMSSAALYVGAMSMWHQPALSLIIPALMYLYPDSITVPEFERLKRSPAKATYTALVLLGASVVAYDRYFNLFQPTKIYGWDLLIAPICFRIMWNVMIPKLLPKETTSKQETLAIE